MQPNPSLAADLALLTGALFDPTTESTTDVAQTILSLASNARLAVTSFVGLTITITEQPGCASEQVVLRLTLLDDRVVPGDIATSLRLNNTTDADQSHLIHVILYAATGGAFVDMAADVSYLTGREVDAADLDQHRGLAGEPDITGILHSDTVIHEAIGVLIGRGRTREQAFAELGSRANATGSDRLTQAAGVLTALTPDRPDLPTPTTPDGQHS